MSILAEDVAQLRKRVADWERELRLPKVRGTLTVGIAAKALLAFEGVLTQTVTILVRALDDAGKARCKVLLGGKTMFGCSLGDKCTLVSGLRTEFIRALSARGLHLPD